MVSTSLSFTVPGRPVPKERPRLGANGNVYTPRRTAMWEDLIAWHVRGERANFGDAPVQVRCTFHVAGRAGDLDNCVKSLLDGIQKSGAIRNDSQVRDVQARIESCGRHEQRTVVTVEALP